MSFFFILNNLHFAFEVFGALVFATSAWLALDSYFLKRDFAVLARFVGFFLLIFWQIIHAFADAGETIIYAGFFFYIAGLALILFSFLLERSVERPKLKAVLVLPALATVALYVNSAAALLYFLIFYFAFRRYKSGFQQTLKTFWLSFIFLSAGAALSIFSGQEILGTAWIAGHVFEFLGFSALMFWVWQYLGLRIREELVLIFVSSALLISIVVTLAFSIILVRQMEEAARINLLTNARVLDLYVGRLKEEAFAKARLLAGVGQMADLLAENDFEGLENLAEKTLESEGLGFLTVVDKDGDVVLRASLPAQKGDNLSDDPAASSALDGGGLTEIAFSPVEKFSIRASSPLIFEGEIVGAVVAGFLLDNATADNLKKVTGLEISIIENDEIVATTLFNPDGRTRSAGIKITDKEVVSAVLERGEEAVLRTEIVSRPALASYLPIKNSKGEIVGALSSVKPQREILELANSVNRLTFVAVAILMLILAFPIYFITRRLGGEGL